MAPLTLAVIAIRGLVFQSSRRRFCMRGFYLSCLAMVVVAENMSW